MDDTELSRLRPIEVRLRVAGSSPGFDGISERAAQSFGRFSADALLVLRALFEDGGLKLGVLTLNGHAPAEPIAPSALFHLWMALTGELARREADPEDTQGAQQIAFARKVLTLLQLDEQLRALSLADRSEADPPASTPDEPAAPADGEETSTG